MKRFSHAAAGSGSAKAARRGLFGRPLRLEALEDRRLLSVTLAAPTSGTIAAGKIVAIQATEVIPAFAGPTNVAAVAGNGDVTISFTPIGGLASYNLYWSTTSPVTTLSNKLARIGSPYAQMGVTNGTTYYYAVTAVVRGLESALSQQVEATPSSGAPIFTWVGGGLDNNWQDAANWGGNVAPAAGDQLVFSGTTQTSTNNDFTGTTFDSIVFANGGFTLSGNALTLAPQSGVAINNLAGSNEIDLPVTVGAGSTLAEAGGSQVSFGGQLTYSGSSDPTSTTQWSANLAGGGSLTKTGADTLDLTGTDSLSGLTTVNGGTLELGPNAQSPVLTGAGANILAGSVLFDYTGSSPAPTIQSDLTTGYNGGVSPWTTGQFQTSGTTLAGTPVTLGWIDNGSNVTVAATIAGDTNCDGSVGFSDLNTLIGNYGSGTTWSEGDFRYTSTTGFADLNALIGNYGQTGPVGAVVIAAVVPTTTDNSASQDVTPSTATTSQPPAPTVSVSAAPVHVTAGSSGGDATAWDNVGAGLGADYIGSRPADGIYNGTYAIVTTDQSPPITMVAPTASNVTLGVVGDSKTRVARHALFASVGEVLDSPATNSVKADWLYV